eukprot:6189298-Pleurochrysis_carterae.AAC.4
MDQIQGKAETPQGKIRRIGMHREEAGRQAGKGKSEKKKKRERVRERENGRLETEKKGGLGETDGERE